MSHQIWNYSLAQILKISRPEGLKYNTLGLPNGMIFQPEHPSHYYAVQVPGVPRQVLFGNLPNLRKLNFATVRQACPSFERIVFDGTQFLPAASDIIGVIQHHISGIRIQDIMFSRYPQILIWKLLSSALSPWGINNQRMIVFPPTFRLPTNVWSWLPFRQTMCPTGFKISTSEPFWG